MTTMPHSNHFIDFQDTREIGMDKIESAPCDQAQIARERFLAQHGPAASWPMRPLLSKENRKALRAAEMARWECFPVGPAGN